MNIMSLSESMALQTLAAQREREEQIKRARKLEFDAMRSQATGKLLKGAMRNQPEMSGFMYVFSLLSCLVFFRNL